MNPFDIEAYRLGESVRLEDDGHIGIPLELSICFDKEHHTVRSGFFGTPIVLYVINTAIGRIGRASDESILCSMLERGYVVLVLDYLHSEKAVCPALDRSVQALRQRVKKKEFLTDDIFPAGEYPENFVVPAGYDVSPYHIFWEADKHGADGTLEKIVENWNNDFRGCRAERLIPWVHADGSRKTVAPSFDGEAPVWYAADGTENENGTFTKVKYTIAEKVTDCVKPDGSPIELRQFLHIIYPVDPAVPVPVMCLANSTEYMTNAPQAADRPHLNGFSFRGYACVVYDHLYTPMVRSDAYAYYDGEPRKGMNAVSGDRWTYSIHLYNGKKLNTAVMRYLRYLALSQPEVYRFDINAFGVYGNSKGGWMTFLGAKLLQRPLIADPEGYANTDALEEAIDRTLVSFNERRQFEGHHSESRYANSITESYEADGVTIHGGERQPWLTYNGKEILSGVQFMYASNGGCEEEMTYGHVPSFNAVHMYDNFGAAYGYTNLVINIARNHDIPSLFFEVPLPHTLAYGEDLHHGVDTYLALFDFTAYHLKHEAVKVVYTDPRGGAADVDVHAPITVKFTAPVSAADIAGVVVTDEAGNTLLGEWSDSFGKTEWTFTPGEALRGSSEYTVTVPASLSGDNGKAMGKEYTAPFTTRIGGVPAVRASKPERTTEIEIYRADFADSLGGCERGRYASLARAKAPDGTNAMRITLGNNRGTYVNSTFYVNLTEAFTCDRILGGLPLTDADHGRQFTVRVRVYDTISRIIQLQLNGCTDKTAGTLDYRRSIYNHTTKAGQWCTYEFDYVVYDTEFGEVGHHVKALTFSAMPDGEQESPLYIGEILVTEQRPL